MRVAILAETYLPYLSGVTVSTEALARGLGRRGHEVLVVAPRPARGEVPGSAGAAGPEPAYAWLPSYQLARPVPPGYRMPVPGRGREVVRQVTRWAPDVVHAQSPFVAGLLARRIARRSGAPLVFTHHTRFADYGHYLGPLAAPGARLTDAYLRRFWASCAAVIAPSSDLAAEISARLGDGRSQPLVRAIATGLEVEAIASLPAHDSRADHGWPPDAVVAVTLGRLAPEKSVDLVLEATAVACAAAPALRLLVIGDGPSAAGLRRRAAAPDLAGRVVFTGRLPRIDALAATRGGDLFVFASRTETQGLVLAEALACGLPAICVDGPGVRDSVRDGTDGIIVPAAPAAGRAAAIGLALGELARDSQRRSAMREAAVAGSRRFAADRRLAEVEQLYRDVARRPA